MTNPFESASSPYLVLVNDEDQHSLWPASADIPSGWTVTFGAASREDCLNHIATTWTDMTPRSLRRRPE